MTMMNRIIVKGNLNIYDLLYSLLNGVAAEAALCVFVKCVKERNLTKQSHSKKGRVLDVEGILTPPTMLQE